IQRAVVYIANQSGVSFDEFKELAGDEAAPAETAAAAPAPEAPAPAAQPAEQAPAAEAEAEAPAAAAAPADQAAAIDPAGEKLYKSVCSACHTTGVAHAPKLGDKAAWAPLIATGL